MVIPALLLRCYPMSDKSEGALNHELSGYGETETTSSNMNFFIDLSFFL